MSTQETRYYIRHPVDIPITIETIAKTLNQKSHTQNVSVGGICFISSIPIEVGSEINIRIETVNPVFKATCEVTWCTPNNGSFEIGIRFISSDEAYRARMVQQVCYIEKFRHELAAERKVDVMDISADEAAKLWITKHAAEFPTYPIPHES